MGVPDRTCGNGVILVMHYIPRSWLSQLFT